MGAREVRKMMPPRNVDSDAISSRVKSRPPLDALEQQVCRVAAEELKLEPERVTPASRLIEDLDCDSLEIVELFMGVEERFAVSLSDRADDPVYKSVFTRSPFRIRDLAELVHLRWGTGCPPRRSARAGPASKVVVDGFTQLGGRLPPGEPPKPLHDPLGKNASGYSVCRRRTDGMVCVQIPSATVRLGTDDPSAMADEQPAHETVVSTFLIDAEPVSTTAYARFLNSVQVHDAGVLSDWFLRAEDDRRREHVPLRNIDDVWHPVPGTEAWPMILVSWYGANAYALWAHGHDWSRYPEEEGSYLPTEAQWEYAARGPHPQRYPWGDAEPTQAMATFARHERGRTYSPGRLPLTPVNAQLGVSPFGLRHMAGNVWQWCRDWYDPAFYGRAEAGEPDPVKGEPTGVRSERGGSWIGSVELLRSSYRRARPPAAYGRCLGFRCVRRFDG